MTNAHKNARRVAHDIIKTAGFTPCEVSEFTHRGALFAFSSESANGFSSSGPAFEVVVDIESSKIIR